VCGEISADCLSAVRLSRYLLHCTVLFATFILLYNRFPLWFVASVYFIVSFTAADLYCKYVEETSMSLGKRLTT
jgi:peptidoglycan/LPS O-acetylase OafA/YrhL